MRWFKHMADSADDEKLAELLAECGLEGYGFWWRLLEVIAAQMAKNDDKCSVAYPLSQWSRLLYSHHNRVGKYLGKLEVIGIVKVEYELSKVRVIVPNLLKYRDEYSKKSRQKPENVGAKKEKQIQKEKQIKDKILSSSSDEGQAEFYITRKKRKLWGKRLETFDLFWNAFGYKTGRAEAADSWIDIPSLTVAIVDKIIAAAKVEAANRAELIASGKTPKMAQGWLSGRRWEDEPQGKLAQGQPQLKESSAIAEARRRIEASGDHDD